MADIKPTGESSALTKALSLSIPCRGAEVPPAGRQGTSRGGREVDFRSIGQPFRRMVDQRQCSNQSGANTTATGLGPVTLRQPALKSYEF